MTYNEAQEALKGLDVRSIGQSEDSYTIVIGNCGRNFDKTRTFKAKKLETVVNQVNKAFRD